MPRQIIDTESSRPAYVRRRARRIVFWLVLLILVIAAFWFLAQHRVLGQESRGPGGTAPLVSFPSTSLRAG